MVVVVQVALIKFGIICVELEYLVFLARIYNETVVFYGRPVLVVIG